MRPPLKVVNTKFHYCTFIGPQINAGGETGSENAFLTMAREGSGNEINNSVIAYYPYYVKYSSFYPNYTDEAKAYVRDIVAPFDVVKNFAIRKCCLYNFSAYGGEAFCPNWYTIVGSNVLQSPNLDQSQNCIPNSGSPLINAANHSYSPSYSHDQVMNPRTVGPLSDIGARERQ